MKTVHTIRMCTHQTTLKLKVSTHTSKGLFHFQSNEVEYTEKPFIMNLWATVSEVQPVFF